jgi:hypothetical protein
VVHDREGNVTQYGGEATSVDSIVEMEQDAYVAVPGGVPKPQKKRLDFIESPFLLSVNLEKEIIDYEVRPEQLDIRIAQMHAFYDKYHEPPKQKGKRENEKELSRWVHTRRTSKGKNDELDNRIVREFHWWSWDPLAEQFDKKINQMYAFYEKYREPPKQQGKRENEKELSRWMQLRRVKKGGNPEIDSRIVREFPWWSWDPLSERVEEKIKQMHAFYEKYHEPPKHCGKRENEKELAAWILNHRVRKNPEIDDRIVREFPWWVWNPLAERFEENIKQMHAFYDKYHEPPKLDGKRENEK